jgi:hypothetical protein
LKGKSAQVIDPRPPFTRAVPLRFIIAGPSLETVIDPSLFYVYQDFEQHQPILSIPVWEARPVNYPATCKFDKIVLDLVATLKPVHQTGGNALEFSNPSFPHISALLNPQQHSMMYPLAAEIVSVSPLYFGRHQRCSTNVSRKSFMCSPWTVFPNR